MAQLLYTRRFPSLELLWGRIQSGEFNIVPAMPMYDIMIVCFCATLNMASLQSCIDTMVKMATEHSLTVPGTGSFLAMLRMGVQLKADIEWARVAWHTFTQSPIRDPARFRVPPDAYRQMLSIYFNSGGVEKAIEYAQGTFVISLLAFADCLPDTVAQARRSECHLNIEFCSQFLTDIIIGGLKVSDPKTLIQLSKWADFSHPSGFRRILTEDELEEFESVLAFAKQLANEEQASELAQASEAPAPTESEAPIEANATTS